MPSGLPPDNDSVVLTIISFRSGLGRTDLFVRNCKDVDLHT